MSNNSLSADAHALLQLLWDDSLSNGGDFGFSDEAFASFPGSAQQFAGLYGGLIAKGLLDSDENVEVNGKRLNGSMFNLTDEGKAALGLDEFGDPIAAE